MESLVGSRKTISPIERMSSTSPPARSTKSKEGFDAMTSRKKKQRKFCGDETFPEIRLNTAGIDVGATEHWVSVPSDRDSESVRCFGGFTRDLYALADWLKQCGIDSVAMESTGVYWIALFEILEERGFDVALVNAKHLKNVAGRKNDWTDCQWIRIVYSRGLVSASFRPPEQIAVLRSYLRHRKMLVEYAAGHVQHMQKALGQMNLHLHHVISDLTGVTGTKILEAILSGDRDPVRMAALRDRRIKNSPEVIAKALEGNYRPEHVFALKQAFDLYRTYRRQIEACDQQIQQHLREFDSKVNPDQTPLPATRRQRRLSKKRNEIRFDCRRETYRIAGVDLTTIDGIDESTALLILSEVGTDMRPWKTERHFSSWLNLSPNHQISGGKILDRKTRKQKNRLRDALRICAQGLLSSQSALGAYCRRICARIGHPKGIIATARKLACLIYRLLKFGGAYVDKGQQHYEQRYKERVVKNLARRAKDYGYQLVPLGEVQVP
jgi:transposase